MVLGVDELQVIVESIKVFSDKLRHHHPEHPLLSLAKPALESASWSNEMWNEYLKGYSPQTKTKVEGIHQNYLMTMMTQLKIAVERTSATIKASRTPSFGFSREGTGEAPE